MVLCIFFGQYLIFVCLYFCYLSFIGSLFIIIRRFFVIMLFQLLSQISGILSVIISIIVNSK